MELDVLLSKFEGCIQIQYNGNLDFKDTLVVCQAKNCEFERE